MAKRPTTSGRVGTDVAYFALSILMIALGGGLIVSAIIAGQTGGALMFGPLHALGAVMVSLGVALFLYRLLNQRNFGKLMSVGGSAAGSLGMFGLIFVMENSSVDFFNKVHPTLPAQAAIPPPPQPPPQGGKISFVAHLDNPNALDGNPAFHGREMRLQVTDPWAMDLLESTIGDTGWVAFNGYDAEGGLEHISAELRPHALTPMKTEVYQHYASQFCVRRQAASWTAVRQVTLNCKLGGACAPTVGETAIAPCEKDLKTAAAGRLVSLFATPAYAAPAAPPPGWVVPDLEGACIANRRLGETFYRFDVAADAPPGAASFGYALRVNGNPVYVDGEQDPRMRKPLVSGAAKLAFVLQNLEFAGTSGPIGGKEQIDLVLRFYDAAGKPVADRASAYQFTALHAPPDASSGGVRWSGVYVLGESQDARQLLIFGGAGPNDDVRPIKTAFDRQGLTYAGSSAQLNGRFPVVAYVRPFVSKAEKGEPNGRDGMPGLSLALRMPDGRVRATFTLADATRLKAWYDAQKSASPVTRGWDNALLYRLRPFGAKPPQRAGCPTT